jgi:MFS family permease
MAYAFLPLQAAAYATISPASTGRATAFYSAQMQLGSAFGVAILSSVLTAVGPLQLSTHGTYIPHLAAYHAAFLAAAALEIIAAAIALTVHDHDAAATMRQQRARPEREELLEQSTELVGD